MPATQEPTVASLGERDLITRLTARLKGGAQVIVGAGDDCAVVRMPSDPAWDLLLTSDPVIEGIHFLPGDDARRVGAKAMGRALSDLAAMGGEPQWGLVNLVLPANAPLATADRLYDGLLAQADAFGLQIVGGDVTEGPLLELHVFAVGKCPAGKAILRSTAQAGDVLFVTGALGGSRLGKHLDFTPRVNEGRWLRPWASAMIDITDGLLTDLRHLLSPAAPGARLQETDIPLAPAATQLADTRSALEHALTDGEDFELLFAIPPDRAATLTEAWRRDFPQPLWNIGVLTTAAGSIECLGADGTSHELTGDGFEHFKRRR